MIVHVFVRDAREHYDLDRLWADAPRIELRSRPAPPAREQTAPDAVR